MKSDDDRPLSEPARANLRALVDGHPLTKKTGQLDPYMRILAALGCDPTELVSLVRECRSLR
jgi:hypothetical protein